MFEKLIVMALTLAERKAERGATATEYALLVSLIAIAIVAGVTLFGGWLNTWFNTMGGVVEGWVNSM